jgi:phosphate uptake regulator
MVVVTVTVHYKVQELKEGQYLINLPKIWARTHKVAKGDILELQILSDGSLRIVPPKDTGDRSPVPSSSPNDGG